MPSPAAGSGPRSHGPVAIDCVGDASRCSRDPGPETPAPRWDTPAVKSLKRGRLPDLGALDLDEARQELEDDVYAATTSGPRASRLRTVRRVLSQWGLDANPLSVEAVKVLGAVLKRGGYRSAAAYLSVARVESEKLAQSPTPPAVLRAIQDAVASCSRGMGPARSVEGLPLELLHKLPASIHGGHRGPVVLKNALVVGAWFMLRELELSSARAVHARVWSRDGKLAVTLLLPSSKQDPEAFGVERTHGCCCVPGTQTLCCPVHAVLDQLQYLLSKFPGDHTAGQPHTHLPLFPCEDGGTCTKLDVVTAIRTAAISLGLNTERADGVQLFHGHSLRKGGAQGLARLGLEVWVIMLLGRWGSSTVMRYIQEAPLYISDSWAPKLAQDLADQCTAPRARTVLSLDACDSQSAAGGVGNVVAAAETLRDGVHSAPLASSNGALRRVWDEWRHAFESDIRKSN